MYIKMPKSNAKVMGARQRVEIILSKKNSLSARKCSKVQSFEMRLKEFIMQPRGVVQKRGRY